MKIHFSAFIIVLSLLSFSCKDEIINNNVYLTDNSEKGNVIVKSIPSGLQIYLENTFTGKFTPDTLKDLSTGLYTISLKPAEYALVSNQVQVKNNISSTMEFPISEMTGKVYVTSFPDSCEILINNISTGKFTPDTIDYIRTNYYDRITLRKGNLYYITEIYSIPGKVVNRNYDLSSSLTIESSPAGAKIFIDSVYSGKRTPFQFTKFIPGDYNISLKLSGYLDTTFKVSLPPGYSLTKQIYLQDSVKLNSFGPVRIFASSSGIQGIDLSTGYGYTVNNGYSVIDIYYQNDGINIGGAHNVAYRYSYMIEEESNNLFDGEDSPVYSNYWGSIIPVDVTNYFYIRDYDNHYSKMIITNRGGSGTTTDPKWIEVKWLYNTKVNDRRF